MNTVMFYGGLFLAATALAVLVIGAIVYRSKKQALDAEMNREYGEKVK